MIWSVLFLYAASSEPAPAPTPTPVPATARRLGDVKLKAPASEAAKRISSASGTAKASDAKPGAAEPPRRDEAPDRRPVPSATPVPDHLDREGHGEAWWRARARTARHALTVAEAALKKAEEEYAEMGGVGGTAAPRHEVAAGPGFVPVRVKASVDEARERVESARRGLERLEQDARRAGAYPGWLR